MTLVADSDNSCPSNRHGNRLDAADKQWHLQSPTPYDPPITYSGWNQARAVGQKIADILRERELQDESAAVAEGSPRRRRKYKVAIHSSPFLRCIQTSIGISAGLASNPEPAPPTHVRANSTTAAAAAANPRLPPTIDTSLSNLPPNSLTNPRPSTSKKPIIQKTVLRLDAFLGEWLTPGYFELITPPPGSGLMLASAKAELLRKEDYGGSFHTHHSPYYNPGSSLGTGQMWGQSPIAAQPGNSLENAGSMVEALRRDSITSNGESHLLSGGAYVAPVPSYAVDHNAEIPDGYVPHARDNCCHVDYQWDSMRGTLDWGDGGALGEEWAAMHQRFRKGLQRMVDWYSTADQPTEMVTKERRHSVHDDECAIEDDEDDVDVESVVILVSHGAGCNALIGAITHQPVLTDVGLASLTQAVRKPGKDENIGLEDGAVAIHQHYDLRLFASTEHLTATRSGRSGSLSMQARGRLSTGNATSPVSGVQTNDHSASRSSSATANLGGKRRESGASSRAVGRIGLNTSGLSGGITVGSGVTRFLQRTPTTSSGAGGLWSPLRNNLEPDDDDDEDYLPNFGSFDAVTTSGKTEDRAPAAAAAAAAAEPSTPVTNGRNAAESRGSNVSPRAPTIPEEPEHHEEEENHVPALPQRGSGTGGLWGSPRPLDEDGIPRDLTCHKRRWTVTERWHAH